MHQTVESLVYFTDLHNRTFLYLDLNSKRQSRLHVIYKSLDNLIYADAPKS